MIRISNNGYQSFGKIQFPVYKTIPIFNGCGRNITK